MSQMSKMEIDLWKMNARCKIVRFQAARPLAKNTSMVQHQYMSLAIAITYGLVVYHKEARRNNLFTGYPPLSNKTWLRVQKFCPRSRDLDPRCFEVHFASWSVTGLEVRQARYRWTQTASR